MSDLLANLAIGFDAALTWEALVYCFAGVFLGTFIGVLPGIGPLAAIAMLLPVTFHLPPVAALIFLAGVYYGALYGGSTAAILLRLPGTAASAVICVDGHAMARAGRANVALVMTTIASFIGGCVAVLVIAGFSPPLARFALGMGPAEYAALMIFGLVAASAMSDGSILKGFGMVLTGLLIGLVGMDVTAGTLRYTFGLSHLADGLSIVVLAMGLFGISEVLNNLTSGQAGKIVKSRFRLRDIIPERRDLTMSLAAIARGTGIGSALGILPGAGPAMSSFASYSVEKQLARDPSRFGQGAIEGVAGPEASNNAAAQTSFIPTLTLGIPGDAIMALILGALMIHGIAPGPNVMNSHPELFWGLIVSFWIGNLMLLVLNLPLIGIWLKILSIPYRILFPTIMLFICIGVYSVSRNPADVITVGVFGIFGTLIYALRCDAVPLILGFILGPMLEEYARRALLFSRGDPFVFIERPLSLTFLLCAVGLVVLTTVPRVLRRMREAKTNTS
jgi:putative tricarboxylic transport membrane protein